LSAAFSLEDRIRVLPLAGCISNCQVAEAEGHGQLVLLRAGIDAAPVPDVVTLKNGGLGDQIHHVLELLFSTGLRVSELCALSKDTFLLKNGELKLLINGKGRKERILQITTPELLQVVQTQPKAAGRPAAFARTADNTTLSIYLMRREDICIFPRRDTKHHCPINTGRQTWKKEQFISATILTREMKQ